MSEIFALKTATSNTTRASLVDVSHAAPKIELFGRVAADLLGKLSQPKTALHLTIVISDPYSGVFGIDGQPTDDMKVNVRNLGKTFSNFMLIRVKFYYNEFPTKIQVRIPVEPPEGMSQHVFAQSIIRKAYNFASYSLPYSFPRHVIKDVMVDGEYNSSSFVAGLLKSVMGYVPKIEVPGFQLPGWDMPIPSSYFKGEAIR
jgi:hypothetical protein